MVAVTVKGFKVDFLSAVGVADTPVPVPGSGRFVFIVT